MGSLLAVGGVDACVRVIDFVSDYPRKNPVKSPYVSHRLRSKIMAVSQLNINNYFNYVTFDDV